jgi:DNA-binding NarL/FixJ family response regulator
MSKSIRIAIADDQALFRKGMVAVLNSIEGFKVVLEAAHGRELLDSLESIDFPDVFIMDLRMPVLNGIETTERLRQEYPESRIVVVSVHNDFDIIEHLFEKGANAYLDKNTEPEEVEKAIRDVYQHDFYFNEAAKQSLAEAAENASHRIKLYEDEKITNREKEVLMMICKEHTNSEIAKFFNLSIRTVEGHRQNLLAKSKSRNTAGLVLFAVKKKILDLTALKLS